MTAFDCIYFVGKSKKMRIFLFCLFYCMISSYFMRKFRFNIAVNCIDCVVC